MPVIVQRGVFPLATLPCIVYERHADNMLNRTLLAGLRLAARLTGNIGLATDLWRSAPLPAGVLYQLAVYALSREASGIATVL